MYVLSPAPDFVNVALATPVPAVKILFTAIAFTVVVSDRFSTPEYSSLEEVGVVPSVV